MIGMGILFLLNQLCLEMLGNLLYDIRNVLVSSKPFCGRVFVRQKNEDCFERTHFIYRRAKLRLEILFVIRGGRKGGRGQ